MLCGVMPSSITLINAEFRDNFTLNEWTSTFYKTIINCSQTNFVAIILILLDPIDFSSSELG